MQVYFLCYTTACAFRRILAQKISIQNNLASTVLTRLHLWGLLATNFDHTSSESDGELKRPPGGGTQRAKEETEEEEESGGGRGTSGRDQHRGNSDEEESEKEATG